MKHRKENSIRKIRHAEARIVMLSGALAGLSVLLFFGASASPETYGPEYIRAAIGGFLSALGFFIYSIDPEEAQKETARERDASNIRETAPDYNAPTMSRAEILEQARAYLWRDITRGPVMADPQTVIDYLGACYAGKRREHFGVLFLDVRHRVLAFEFMFSGTIDGAAVYPREIARRALELNAAALILSHNHPSGVPDPSLADQSITRRIRDGLALLDIRVLDHVIIGERAYSMAEHGMIADPRAAYPVCTRRGPETSRACYVRAGKRRVEFAPHGVRENAPEYWGGNSDADAFMRAVEFYCDGLDVVDIVGAESFFSWAQCDSCGSRLGGGRIDAIGAWQGANGWHQTDMQVCIDCAMFHANGEAPETWADGIGEKRAEYILNSVPLVHAPSVCRLARELDASEQSALASDILECYGLPRRAIAAIIRGEYSICGDSVHVIADPRAHYGRAPMDTVRAFALITGEESADLAETVRAWSYLVEYGIVWELSGAYQRRALDLMARGIIRAPRAVAETAPGYMMRQLPREVARHLAEIVDAALCAGANENEIAREYCELKRAILQELDAAREIAETAPDYNRNGAIIWEGKSTIDGAPIVVIATGLTEPSANDKTGPMIQTWIIRADIAPMTAISRALDVSVCGSCPLRNGACYVELGRAPTAIYNAMRRGRYARLGADSEIFAGRAVRVGSYGNPSAAPFDAWRPVFAHASVITGYEHLWQTCDPRFKLFCMASVESLGAAKYAQALGWRTFRVSPNRETVKGEAYCPAGRERRDGSRVQCIDCGACNGNPGNWRGAGIAIQAHGSAPKLKAYGALTVSECRAQYAPRHPVRRMRAHSTEKARRRAAIRARTLTRRQLRALARAAAQ